MTETLQPSEGEGEGERRFFITYFFAVEEWNDVGGANTEHRVPVR